MSRAPLLAGNGVGPIRAAVAASLTIVILVLTVPVAEADHGMCVDRTYGPRAFSDPSQVTEPVDVSYSDESDFQQRLVSYDGTLYVLWLTEEEDPEVTEFLQMRAMGPEGWGPKQVVNNPVPGEGHFQGRDVRVAGYDVAVHGGLLWVVWSTPAPSQSDGTDGDIVYRTFDGQVWSQIGEITPAGDSSIDVTPSVGSTGDRLVVAWATSAGSGRRIVTAWWDGDGWSPVAEVTSQADGGDDFNPVVSPVDQGALVAWHHRDVASEDPTQVSIMARLVDGQDPDPAFPVSGTEGFEDIWLDTRWTGDRLMMVWQRGGRPLGFERSQIIYREWTVEGMGPEVDITGESSGAYNGRPRLGVASDGPRVYWHTDDDGVTLGTSEDLVWRGLGAGGTWGPLRVLRAAPSQDMVRVHLAEHRGTLWASWMANVTFTGPPDWEPEQAWDVFVGPAEVAASPYQGVTVQLRWEGCEDEVEDRFDLLLSGTEGPLEGVPMEVSVTDRHGVPLATVEGVTDLDGRMVFENPHHPPGLAPGWLLRHAGVLRRGRAGAHGSGPLGVDRGRHRAGRGGRRHPVSRQEARRAGVRTVLAPAKDDRVTPPMSRCAWGAGYRPPS